MGLRPRNELSKEYDQIEAILNGGWRGSRSQLAVCIGRTSRSVLVIRNLVESYARRNPQWDHTAVTASRVAVA